MKFDWLKIKRCGLLDTYTIADNPSGRYFIVTDIHGNYELLIKSLEYLDFQSVSPFSAGSNHDFLLSLGDNCDRGKNSYQTLSFFKNNHFCASLLGNHEEMYRLAIKNKFKGGCFQDWQSSGGDVWVSTVDDWQHLELYDWLSKLAVGAELKFNGLRIALTHGDLLTEGEKASWGYTKSILKESVCVGDNDLISEIVLCGRRSFRDSALAFVSDAHCVVHGHTPLKNGDIKISGNTVFIDTNAVHSYIKLGKKSYLPHEFNMLTILEVKKGGALLGVFKPYYFTLDEYGNIVEK